jgi:hypothetical protein
MMRAVVVMAALLAAVQAAVQAEAAAQPMPRRQGLSAQTGAPGGRGAAGVVHLRGLDSLNGTASDIDVAVGGNTRFGHLEISAEACRVSGDDGAGDAYALLRIRDVREPAPRFAGWMFASSPALSALDHPRYDVWVLSCSNR